MIWAATIDWWARGIAIVSLALAAVSVAWNVYTWRQTHRVSLKVRSQYVWSNLLDPQRPTVNFKVMNRGAGKVVVTDLKRQFRKRRSGRLGRWEWLDERPAQIFWGSHNNIPISRFPLEMPAGDSVTLTGQDETFGPNSTPNPDMQWTFRIVLDDGHRFRGRPNMRRARDGKLERVWPRKTHRVPTI